MYKIISMISTLVRQFLVPNPFEPLALADLYNFIAEPAMWVVTYLVVGLFYQNRREPAIGSLLYLIFYFVHTGVLWVMGLFHWDKTAVTTIAVIYFIAIAGIAQLRSERA